MDANDVKAIMRRWLRRNLLATGCCVFLFIVAISVTLLGFAHAFWNGADSNNSKCFASIAQGQWPKWIGCAMARHENLAGGLFGFGGALFAAWVAAQGLSRQTRVTLLTREEDRIETELAGLRSAREWVNAVRDYLTNADGQVERIVAVILSHSRATLDDTIRFLEHERVLNTTPDPWRRDIARDLIRMRIVIPGVSDGGTRESVYGDLQFDKNGREAVLGSINGLDAIIPRLEQRIAELEERAKPLREELDAYFRK